MLCPKCSEPLVSKGLRAMDGPDYERFDCAGGHTLLIAETEEIRKLDIEDGYCGECSAELEHRRRGALSIVYCRKCDIEYP